MDRNLLMVVVLVVLVLVATVQAVQLTNIRGEIENLGNGATLKKTVVSSSGTKISSSSSGVPTNLQSLPGMVGGC